jgi:glycosyltransferase involved in cell wall biosynthesis
VLHVVFVAWRDLANPGAGGSEVLVDRLARGLVDRGHEVTQICGGPVAQRPYRVVSCGGTYSQYLRAPFTFRRQVRDCDLLVEVCNGMPYLAPLWCGRPVVCLVNHVHTALWRTRLSPPLSTAGRFVERSLMPYVHRRNLFIAVSDSTAEALAGIGVDRDRIRLLFNGVEPPPAVEPEADQPLFLSLGRLTAYKRVDLLLRLWERVRPVVGGYLIVAGEGPERANLSAMAGRGVHLLGRVSDVDKRRLLGRAWLLLHPALVEGWGLVVNEAAIHRTPTVAFDAPGLRDSVVHGETGMLADGAGAFASAWASLALAAPLRHRMGAAAQRRAAHFTWDASVERFLAVAYEAVERGRRRPA